MRLSSFSLLIVSVVCLLFTPTVDVAAAPPTVTSVRGCVNSRSTTISCHTNTLITIAGNSFGPVLVTTVTLVGWNETYSCNNLTVSSTTTLICRVPSVSPVDIERPLNLFVTVSNARSSVLSQAVQSYGPLILTSAIGCPSTSSITGSAGPAYRTSGCLAGQIVTLIGDGFGNIASTSNNRVSVGNAAWSPVTVLNRTHLLCTLGAPLLPGTWLAVQLQIGADVVTVPALISYSSSPFISAVSGCINSLSTTGQCHTSQTVTVTGGLFVTPINVTLSGVYRYLCTSVRLASSSSIRCTVPEVQWEDQGRWLNVTIFTVNSTLTFPYSFQSYGTLSVTSTLGCTPSLLNQTLRSASCNPGSNLTVVGTGFGPGILFAYIFGERLAMCQSTVWVSNVSLTCVGLPTAQLADVFQPVQVRSGTVTVTSPVPLVSFSVIPHVLAIVSGCLMVDGMASQCHPTQSITARVSNLTANNEVTLYGQGTAYRVLSLQWGGDQLMIILPERVDDADVNQPLDLIVRVGNSASPRFTRAVSMVNTLTVTGISGCVNSTSPNMTGLCVPGVTVLVKGSGFTTNSWLIVGGYVSPLCIVYSYESMECRLPSVDSIIPATPLMVSVRSGTATSVNSNIPTVSYIPTPVVSSITAASSSGCTSQRTGPALRDCRASAVITLSGSSFFDFTTVTLYDGPISLPCTITYTSSRTLRCALPDVPIILLGPALSLLVNNSLPTLSGPITSLPSVLTYSTTVPPPPPATRLGLTLDQLVLVIMLVTVLSLVLVLAQVVCCMVRYGGVRFVMLEKMCPGVMARMRRRGEGGEGSSLGMEPLNEGAQGGQRGPYRPSALQFAVSSSSQPPAPAPPSDVYDWYQRSFVQAPYAHLTPPDSHSGQPHYLVPPPVNYP